MLFRIVLCPPYPAFCLVPKSILSSSHSPFPLSPLPISPIPNSHIFTSSSQIYQRHSLPRHSCPLPGHIIFRNPNQTIGKLLNEGAERFSLPIKRRHVSTGHGLQGFVLYSSYRLNMSSFVVLGLSPMALHSLPRVNSCRQMGADDFSIPC
ncbi:unnamed protein product [Closterium sp. NIES-54]